MLIWNSMDQPRSSAPNLYQREIDERRDLPTSGDRSMDSQSSDDLEEGAITENVRSLYSYSEFRREIEVLFKSCEAAICRNQFLNLEYVKNFILCLWDVGHRYASRGCEEDALEDILLRKALTTADGVKRHQKEIYNPQQTTIFICCAMAVFPCTIKLTSDTGVQYKLSTCGSSSLPLLDELSRYCVIIANIEEMAELQSTVQLKRLLLNLAEWLEVKRAPVTFLITCKCLPVLGALINRFKDTIDLQKQVYQLYGVGLVLAASSLVREQLMPEARNFHNFLMRRGFAGDIPPSLQTRHLYVHARLLQNCGEIAKALELARDALHEVSDTEEKKVLTDLIKELMKMPERPVNSRNLKGPVDLDWLEGTNALQNKAHSRSYADIRQKHHSRKKTRKVPVNKRGQTPHSPANQHQRPGDSHRLTGMSLSDFVNSEESSDEEDERDIRFIDSYDDDEEEKEAEKADECMTSDDNTRLVDAEIMEEESDEQDWFEKSEAFTASGDIGEEDVILLSEWQENILNKRVHGRDFYPDFRDNPRQLLEDDRNRFKRCQLNINMPHQAIAKVLDKGSKYAKILIKSRVNAGRSFMDDEVVVEVLAEPGPLNGLQQSNGAGSSSSALTSVEKMAHGKVVGLLKRVRFANDEHPVLFCTLDTREGHFMKPLCKTIPKIYIMNKSVREKFPTLVKNRIEIKTISPEGEVKFKGYCDVQPDKREQYIFKVIILSWTQDKIYPLGAVLEANINGKDYSAGLQVLCMQQRVPKLYPRGAVEDTKRIVEKGITSTGRVDLTSERLFTVDPPGTRELDDAISVRSEGEHVVIAVHITDVAAVVEKDSGVDLEARRRAFTFYPLHRKPHCMLPEPLSHDHCSLLPAKPRLAFSVFFRFNHKGTLVGDPEIKRTLIRSQQQLTYEQAQRVIDGHAEDSVDLSIQKDIIKIHKVTAMLQKKRKKDSVLFIPFEDPRLLDLEQLNECMEAHSMIEELMILTNQYVANFLTRQPQLACSMIVRCHKAPTWEELQQWQNEEGSVTDIVLQLQGQQVTPSTHLSFHNRLEWRGQVVVQRQVWKQLCEYLEKGQVEKARRLAFMDGLHPLQSLAVDHWLDIMQTAEYTSAQENDLRHFGLNLLVYTHFTSPIRRYPDLHVQRILHAALDGKATGYNQSEVLELCQHINSASTRQKAFSKGCQTIKMAESLQRQPLVFKAYVDAVDEKQLTLSLPSLQALPDHKQKLSFSMLGVSCQPEMLTDTATKTVTVTAEWNCRFYNEAGKCPGPLLSVWKCPGKKKSRARLSQTPNVLTIRPDILSEAVRQEDWVKILKFLASGEESCWSVPQQISRKKFEVEYISSEKGDGTAYQMPVKFKSVYSPGQIVEVQMSAELKNGVLKPRVEILHAARNACVCIQHVTDPVLTLTRSATLSVQNQQFSSRKEYLKAWMSLVEMEAAMRVTNSNGTIIIDDINVAIRRQTSPNSARFIGSFTLSSTYCYNRCIEFGGKSVDSITKDYKSEYSFPLDYLCLRYKAVCSSTVVSRIAESQVQDTVDKHYTWLAHASVVKVQHKDHKAQDGGKVVVIFALSPSSPPPLPQLMTKGGARIMLEILPMTEVDRRSQEMLLRLENSKCELVQAIAYGQTIPELECDHIDLGMMVDNHEVNIGVKEAPKPVPCNNSAQLTAIQLAMTNSLAIIQGPPGTILIDTGIKLVYLFCKINRQLQAAGKGRKTVLYCGPSNKSVDLMARNLKSQLGTKCPKIVRMYGSTIESKDYPVPVGDVGSTRDMQDLKSDSDLQDVALHHLIREEGKPYSQDIATFDKKFEKCIKFPRQYTVTVKDLRAYRKRVFKASVEELKHYEVILCTCDEGNNRMLIEGTEGSIYQLIIDECAMNPEPQSMVPIVATQPKQVVLIGDHNQPRPVIKCQPAAKLGMDQSLFERLLYKFPKYRVLNVY